MKTNVNATEKMDLSFWQQHIDLGSLNGFLNVFPFKDKKKIQELILNMCIKANLPVQEVKKIKLGFMSPIENDFIESHNYVYIKGAFQLFLDDNEEWITVDDRIYISEDYYKEYAKWIN